MLTNAYPQVTIEENKSRAFHYCQFKLVILIIRFEEFDYFFELKINGLPTNYVINV